MADASIGWLEAEQGEGWLMHPSADECVHTLGLKLSRGKDG